MRGIYSLYWCNNIVAVVVQMFLTDCLHEFDSCSTQFRGLLVLPEDPPSVIDNKGCFKYVSKHPSSAW